MPHPSAIARTAALALLTASALLAATPSIDRAIDLHTSGRLREALREYRAVAAAEPEVKGVALTNACALQMDLGEYRAALPDCREALRLSREAGDPGEIAWALNNLGLALQSLGESSEAEPLFQEALATNRRRGDAESQVINLSNLGSLALAAGRYSAALRLQAEAAALASRHRGEPWAAEQAVVAGINQGAVLEKLGAYREALDLYKGMLAAAGGLGPGRRAALLVNSGVIYRNLGDPVRAVESFREAAEAYRLAGDQAGLSNAWLNLGLAHHLNLARPGEAEAAYREALRLAEASGDRTEEIQDLFYLGQLLLERGRLDEAEAVYRRSLAIAREAGSAEGRWSAREGLGRIARARGDLAAALQHFRQALEEIEKVRSGLARGGRRAGYFGDKRAVYAAAVETLAALERREPGRGWGERALGIVQRAKARDLLDALGDGGQPAVPLAAGELRLRIGDGAALEYFVGEENLYLWVIQAGGIRLHDLGKAGPILDSVSRVYHALSRGEEPSATALSTLSYILLGPIRSLPRGDAPLRIAPDGALHYLPFELLEDPAVPGAPLLERAAVSYLPSASTLAGLERSGDPSGVRLAGFAAPRLPRAGSGPPSPRDLLVERFGLAPLPASARELETVERLLGGPAAVFTGGRATEKAFRDAVEGGARVVHLATHTVIDERPGRGSAILLTASGEDDGLLYPEEIARLRDRSDLTVLAACRTALGPGPGGGNGQALATLTGSFLAAGSRGVVATLWDVGDAATAAFMEQLYWELGQGREPAEALRRAKLRLRQDPRWRRADLWAGYVLIGEAPAVAPRQAGWPVWTVAGLLTAAVLGWLWRSFRVTSP